MSKDTSGPAFPSEHYASNQGMTLRDWFAGQALSSEAMFRAYNTRPDLMAKYAFELADAMIAKRNKP